MSTRYATLPAALAAVALLAGCASYGAYDPYGRQPYYQDAYPTHTRVYSERRYYPPDYRYDQRYDYQRRPSTGSAQTAGTLLGGAVGGLIGNQIGKGSGRVAATVGGVVLGAAVGNSIGRDVDAAHAYPRGDVPRYRDDPYAYPYDPRGDWGY